MATVDPQLELLIDLENRHDDVLRRLDDLDRQVQAVLAEYAPERSVRPESLQIADCKLQIAD